MSIFRNKVLLITGGTGSFGNAVLRRFLDSDIKEIRIFSRDEKKQDDMRHHLQNPKVKFISVMSVTASLWTVHDGSGLCVFCRCFETGSQLRVLPIAGCADQCDRYRQCTGIRHSAWCKECSGAFYRQGRLSHQCHRASARP